ncbi:MAG: hypothetical protein HY700_08645 [Gemmatimonadetes bacterium]|nr:hypothetical protein [Gemmatimonadota bacterium]
MSLPLILSVPTLALGFLPAVWLWHARARGKRDSLLTLATAGGIVTFAYAAGPWLFVSYWLRYVALATYGAVAFTSWGSRRRLVPATSPEATRLSLLLRVAALVTVLALNGLAFTAGMAPDGAVEMAFPFLHGTYTVLQGGNSLISNPFHRASATERFAVDLVKLNSYGARAKGLAPDALASYAVFDDSVMSPCDGTVAEAVDGVADNPPGRANVAVPAGNHLILRCDGVELLLAHLRAGSVTVPSNTSSRGSSSVGLGIRGTRVSPICTSAPRTVDARWRSPLEGDSSRSIRSMMREGPLPGVSDESPSTPPLVNAYGGCTSWLLVCVGCMPCGGVVCGSLRPVSTDSARTVARHRRLRSVLPTSASNKRSAGKISTPC